MHLIQFRGTNQCSQLLSRNANKLSKFYDLLQFQRVEKNIDGIQKPISSIPY